MFLFFKSISWCCWVLYLALKSWLIECVGLQSEVSPFWEFGDSEMNQSHVCPPSVTMASISHRKEKERRRATLIIHHSPHAMLMVASGLSRLFICKVSSDEFLHYLLLMYYCIGMMRREGCWFYTVLPCASVTRRVGLTVWTKKEWTTRWCVGCDADVWQYFGALCSV